MRQRVPKGYPRDSQDVLENTVKPESEERWADGAVVANGTQKDAEVRKSKCHSPLSPGHPYPPLPLAQALYYRTWPLPPQEAGCVSPSPDLEPTPCSGQQNGAERKTRVPRRGLKMSECFYSLSSSSAFATRTCLG